MKINKKMKIALGFLVTFSSMNIGLINAMEKEREERSAVIENAFPIDGEDEDNFISFTLLGGVLYESRFSKEEMPETTKRIMSIVAGANDGGKWDSVLMIHKHLIDHLSFFNEENKAFLVQSAGKMFLDLLNDKQFYKSRAFSEKHSFLKQMSASIYPIEQQTQAYGAWKILEGSPEYNVQWKGQMLGTLSGPLQTVAKICMLLPPHDSILDDNNNDLPQILNTIRKTGVKNQIDLEIICGIDILASFYTIRSDD